MYIETIIFYKYEGEFSPLTIYCTSILYTSETLERSGKYTS